MNHQKRPLLFALVGVWISAQVLAAPADNEIPGLLSQLDVRELEVKSGTLEPLPSPRQGYIFSYGGKIDVYEQTITSSFSFHEFWIRGFVFDNGKRLRNNGEGPDKLRERFARENPGAKLVAHTLAGNGHITFEVRLEGKTPIYRVRVKSGEQEATLWLNREEAEGDLKK